MSKPVKPGANDAAEYVLGLLGKEDQPRVCAATEFGRGAAGPGRVLGEHVFRPAGGRGRTAAAGMFEKILDRIEGEGADLPGTVTRRAGSANWFEISPGIKGRLLHVDRAQNRQYLLIRMAPGASYHPHAHDTDEQSLVLEGDLSFGDLDLKAGDFHVATPSSSHPPGRTVNGCLVHVVMSLDQH